MAEQKIKEELKTLTSMKELTLDGPELQIDLEEDAWSYGAPPPAGDYKVKWFLDKDGLKVGYGKKADPATSYIRATIVGKIVDNEEWNDTTVYDYLDTRIFRGKKTSTMMGFLVKAVGQGQVSKHAPFTAKKIATLLEGLLKKEPIVRCELDWKGSYKWTNDKGDESYENVYNHYTDFPVDPEDKTHRLHECQVKGKGGQMYDVRAQLRVARHLAKDEESKLVSKPRTGGNASSTPMVLAEEPEITPTPIKSSVVQSKPTTAPVVGDDSDSMDLMME